MVFIGGRFTPLGLLGAWWEALPFGGRLVVNTVRLESEALLADAYRRHGGDPVKLAVARAVPVRGCTGWRQALPAAQCAARKAARATANLPPGADR
ncbi:hypothetical protein [Streptomyces griseus]|uniref:hypothetical protein n=1 Tax=Streptomyces griseus TaxID=1911 RepID=UPI00373AF1F2